MLVMVVMVLVMVLVRTCAAHTHTHHTHSPPSTATRCTCWTRRPCPRRPCLAVWMATVWNGQRSIHLSAQG